MRAAKKVVYWLAFGLLMPVVSAANQFASIGKVFNDLLDLYRLSPYFVDFALLMTFFGIILKYSLKRIEDEKARNSIAVVLAVFLSLTLVFAMRAMGYSLFAYSKGKGIISETTLVFLALLLVLGGIFLILGKEKKWMVLPFALLFADGMLGTLKWYEAFLNSNNPVVFFITLVRIIAWVLAIMLIVKLIGNMISGGIKSGIQHGTSGYNDVADAWQKRSDIKTMRKFGRPLRRLGNLEFKGLNWDAIRANLIIASDPSKTVSERGSATSSILKEIEKREEIDKRAAAYDMLISTYIDKINDNGLKIKLKTLVDQALAAENGSGAIPGHTGIIKHLEDARMAISAHYPPNFAGIPFTDVANHLRLAKDQEALAQQNWIKLKELVRINLLKDEASS